jgi:hypothetical protein
MKLKSTSLSLAIMLASALAYGQDVTSTESPVLLNATIVTQGAATTRTGPGGSSVTSTMVHKPFGNREIVAAMVERELIAAPPQGWLLVCVKTGDTSVIQAKKTGATSVNVPADLLTLPVQQVILTGGTQVTGPRGTIDTTTKLGDAAAVVAGVEVSGLAGSTNYALTSPTGQLVSGTVMALPFSGGAAEPARIVRGSLTIGRGKILPRPPGGPGSGGPGSGGPAQE